MDEREKIIKIIAPFISAYGEDEAIADALIAANIGDVTAHEAEAEYWKTICKFEGDEYHTTIKNAAEHARHLMQERDEWKERAERALRTAVSVLDAEYRAFGVNRENKTEQRIKNFIEQAEKELAKEKKE